MSSTWPTMRTRSSRPAPRDLAAQRSPVGAAPLRIAGEDEHGVAERPLLPAAAPPPR